MLVKLVSEVRVKGEEDDCRSDEGMNVHGIKTKVEYLVENLPHTVSIQTAIFFSTKRIIHRFLCSLIVKKQ